MSPKPITKCDLQKCSTRSWKPIYHGLKDKVTSHKTGAGIGLCTFVSAGFLQLCLTMSCVYVQMKVIGTWMRGCCYRDSFMKLWI